RLQHEEPAGAAGTEVLLRAALARRAAHAVVAGGDRAVARGGGAGGAGQRHRERDGRGPRSPWEASVIHPFRSPGHSSPPSKGGSANPIPKPSRLWWKKIRRFS